MPVATEFDRSMAPPIASNPEPLKLAFTLSATMVTFGVLAAAANPMALFLVATLSSIVTIALPLLPDAFATNPAALLVSVTFLRDAVGELEPLRSSQTPTPEFKETIRIGNAEIQTARINTDPNAVAIVRSSGSEPLYRAIDNREFAG